MNIKKWFLSTVLLIPIFLLFSGCHSGSDSRMTVKSINVSSFFFDSTLSIPIEVTGTFGTCSGFFTTKQKSDNSVAVFKNAIENLNNGYTYTCDSFEEDALAIKQVSTSGEARYYVLRLFDTGEILITDSRIELSSRDSMEKGVSTLLLFPYHLLAEQSFKSVFTHPDTLTNSSMTYETVFTIRTAESVEDFYDFYSSTGKYKLEKTESGFSILDDYGSGFTALVFDFTQSEDALNLSVHMT